MSDAVAASGEVYALDLDWDLVLHLANPDSVRALQAERLSTKVLEDDFAVKVFQWQLSHIRKHGHPATATVLEDEFPDLVLEEPQTAIGDLIQRLRDRYMKNEGRRALRDIAKLAGENPTAVASEMLRVGKELVDVTSQRGNQFGSGDANRALDVYHKKVLRGPGPTLGFEELDAHFNGIQGLTFVIAPPKTYKSWFAVNGLLEEVMDGKHPYLYSLELPAEDTTWRSYSMAADVPYWKYERGCQSPEDLERINIAAQGLDGYGVYNIDKPPPGERSVHLLVERAMAAEADCIFIDQLQYVENENGKNLGTLNDTGAYWDILSTLRDYSDDVPIFIVHQFNRSVMNSKEMPEMQQAKGSAAIEETAHLALGLWANKEMRRNNVIEIGTLASRSYSYKSWHVGVELSKGCSLKMLGEVTDEEE